MNSEQTALIRVGIRNPLHIYLARVKNWGGDVKSHICTKTGVLKTKRTFTSRTWIVKTLKKCRELGRGPWPSSRWSRPRGYHLAPSARSRLSRIHAVLFQSLERYFFVYSSLLTKQNRVKKLNGFWIYSFILAYLQGYNGFSSVIRIAKFWTPRKILLLFKEVFGVHD